MLRITQSLTGLKLIKPSSVLIQKRHISRINQKYIESFGQNIDEKNLAFWSGFLISGVVPLNFIVSYFTHLHTEHHMLKNIEKIKHLPLNEKQVFTRQIAHKHYFLLHNGANGMFIGSLFNTVIRISAIGAGLGTGLM